MFLNYYRRFLPLLKDPLYVNSVFMMASTAVVSGSGFFFWVFAARLYKDVEVGLATAIISVVMFIMNLSILGLNYSIIRFLPKSKEKNKILSGSFWVITLASVVCAGVFLLFLPFFSLKLVFMRESAFTMLAFVFFTVAVSVDFATESVFLAMRAGKYIFLKNILVCVLKFCLPFLFVPFGAVGLFIAWAMALSSALVVSFFVIFRKLGFRFVSFDKGMFRSMMGFSFVNFVVGLLGIAPGLILPVMITNVINPETSAYFYVAFMIANLLYTIPYATTQSLFAEGAYDESNFVGSVKKAFKLIGFLLIPGILFLVLFGHLILWFFGEEYSAEGVRFLQILAVSGVPVAINYVGLTVLNVRRETRGLLVINVVGTVVIIGLSYLLRSYALTGVGLAWLGGHVVKNVLYGGFIGLLEFPSFLVARESQRRRSR